MTDSACTPAFKPMSAREGPRGAREAVEACGSRAGRLTGMTDSASPFPARSEGLAGNFVDWLGLEFVEMTGDQVVCTWTVEPRMHQPYGILHGGIHCSVVETLASLGAAVWLGDRGKVVGVNNNTDFYRADQRGGDHLHRDAGAPRTLPAGLGGRDGGRRRGKVAARGQVRLQNLSRRAT